MGQFYGMAFGKIPNNPMLYSSTAAGEKAAKQFDNLVVIWDDWLTEKENKTE